MIIANAPQNALDSMKICRNRNSNHTVAYEKCTDNIKNLIKLSYFVHFFKKYHIDQSTTHEASYFNFPTPNVIVLINNKHQANFDIKSM